MKFQISKSTQNKSKDQRTAYTNVSAGRLDGLFDCARSDPTAHAKH